MHGIVFKGLKDYVVEEHGIEGWRAVQEAAGLPDRIYVPVAEYPDEEVMALVGAACEVTGAERAAVLESFGRYLVGPLIETYGVHVDGDWTGLELLANVETYIHRALRGKQIAEFTPPDLTARREAEDRVAIVYGSDRQLCDFARGLVLGIGDHYGERYEVSERTCMLEGDDRCELVARRVAEPDERSGEAGSDRVARTQRGP